MSTLLQLFAEYSINQEIERHPAWLGPISGLKAEKLLRGRKKPYLYVLRAGEGERENETDYYVSFIIPDFSIKHQPFVITVTSEGWYFENAGIGGPYTHASIDDVLHLMMHCPKEACLPLIL
jgi:hypothetical protein